MTSADSPASSASRITLALCVLVALIEGIDIQSIGVAAPMLGPALGLDQRELGQALAASPVGLLVGALLAGRLADVVGRKAMLVASMITFGVFTLATVWVDGVTSLWVIRFLTGVGLGGAMPNLAALSSEAAGDKSRIASVVVTFAGMPIGGAIVSWVAWLGLTGGDWRPIFYVGGIAPLVLAPVIMLALPESRRYREARAEAGAAPPKLLTTLFGEGRASATVCLWIAFSAINLLSYLLLNWLPSLLVAKGLASSQAAVIQIVFNLASAIGAVILGVMMDRRPGRLIPAVCFVGVGIGLLVLSRLGPDFAMAATVVGLIGVFLYGALYILYGVMPLVYPTLGRGAGAGASVAIGRIGAIAGPMIAGELLVAGRGAGDVLLAMLPVIAVAAAAAMTLLWRSMPQGYGSER